MSFLGATDNQPLEFKVNSERVLRMEYATSGSLTAVSVIGGYSSNSVGSTIGATVFGGSVLSGPFGSVVPFPNRVGDFGAVSGGFNNKTTTGDFATVLGGLFNSAGPYGFAAGRSAKANHEGAFVWAGSTGDDSASAADNQFSVRASGGVRFETGGVGISSDGPIRTTANQPLEFKANGLRALKLQPGNPSLDVDGPRTGLGGGQHRWRARREFHHCRLGGCNNCRPLCRRGSIASSNFERACANTDLCSLLTTNNP